MRSLFLLLVFSTCLVAVSLGFEGRTASRKNPYQVLWSVEETEPTPSSDPQFFGADNGGGYCDPYSNETVCNGEGDCVQDDNGTFICVCNEEYTGSNCEDKRKAKLTAFLLSFFVGMYGADR